jgi:hypothetical protein
MQGGKRSGGSAEIQSAIALGRIFFAAGRTDFQKKARVSMEETVGLFAAFASDIEKGE